MEARGWAVTALAFCFSVFYHSRVKVAFLATDNREHYKDYSAARPYFGTAPEALLQGMAALPELEVHVISCIRQPVKSPERLASNIFFHSLHVPKMGWIRTGYQGCIRATRAKVREIQPHLAHAQGTERDCATSAIFSGVPSVLTIHGNMRRVAHVMKARPFSYLWLAARLEQFVLPRTAGVVCISTHTLRQVEGLTRRTWLVPNAVDASFFEVERAPAPPAPNVVCVGQVYSLKNQNAFIRALDPIAKTHQFTVEFLGEAKPGQPYAEEFLGLVGQRPWCHHFGFANRAQLQEKLSRASLLAQVSLEDNCPMAILEAMASGVPVLASSIGGMPDLVEEGRTGWFCDPHDQASMRAGFEKFITNPARAAQFGRSAREVALKKFHPQEVARTHLRIYEELLRERAETQPRKNSWTTCETR